MYLAVGVLTNRSFRLRVVFYFYLAVSEAEFHVNPMRMIMMLFVVVAILF